MARIYGKYLPNENDPLFVAVRNEDVRVLKRRLAAGDDVNKKDSVGNTALTHAIFFNSVECLRVLLEAGANVNFVHRNRGTPLRAAVETGHLECVKLLLDAGADVKTQCKRNRTVLMRALHLRKKRTQCVKLLVDAGADVNFEVMMATPLKTAVMRGDVECVRILVEAGANVNTRGPSRESILEHAVCKPTDIGRILVDAGADVSSVLRSGFLALCCGSCRHCVPWAKWLLAAGVEVCTDAYCMQSWKPCDHLLTGQPLIPSLCLLLLAAGESFSRDAVKTLKGTQHHELQEIERYYTTERDLQSQCRKVIRRHLLSVSGVNLFHQVERLPLPEVMKNFLLFYLNLDQEK